MTVGDRAPPGGSTPAHVTADGKHKGKPLIANKNGVYVLDSAAMTLKKQEDELSAKEESLASKETTLSEQRKTMVSQINELQAAATASGSSSGPTRIPQPPPQPPTDNGVVAKLDAIRAACLQN